MTARRIVTAALARQCQREYERDEGRTPMKAIAARHGVSAVSLRKARSRLGLPAVGHSYGGGGGKKRFVPEADAALRWDVLIRPGWRVHGVARA